MATIQAFAAVSYVKINLSDVARPKEKHYQRALVAELKNSCKIVKTEVKFAGGRADIITETHAIEVERASKWHEAIGQSLHYALIFKKKPCIAIFDASKLGFEKRRALLKLAKRRKIDLIFIEN